MSQTPVKTNMPVEAPGAPRKTRIEHTIAPDTTITNLRLKFEAEEEEVVAETSPLDTAMLIEEEAEQQFIEWLRTAPSGAFSYEGLAEAMMEAE